MVILSHGNLTPPHIIDHCDGILCHGGEDIRTLVADCIRTVQICSIFNLKASENCITFFRETVLFRWTIRRCSVWQHKQVILHTSQILAN